MSKVNCACPKCGKWTTEYEEDKWRCLHCGNKFVIKPDVAPTYINNSSLSINGDSLFDIEPNGIPFSPTLIEVKETLTKAYSEVYNDFPWLYLPHFWKISAIIFVICSLFMEGTKDSSSSDLKSVVGMIATICVLLGFARVWLWFKQWEELNKKMEETKVEIAVNIYCPNCRSINYNNIIESNLFEINTAIEYYGQLNSQFSNHSFHHCKSCGKQFYVMDEKTCKIKSS